MHFSPIQLRSFVYERVSLETDLDGPDGGKERQPPVLNFDVEWVSSPTVDEDGLLRLTLTLNADQEDWSLYRGEIVVVGRFAWVRIDDEVDEDTRERYYLASGFSILYGLVRGFAVQLTASSPHPRLLLPSFDFSPAVDDLVRARSNPDEVEPSPG